MIRLFRVLWIKLTAWTWGWPGWLVELASGLFTDAVALPFALLLALAGVPLWLGLLGIATGLSVVYEAVFDANGWSLLDVAQREVGIILGAVVIALLSQGGLMFWIVVVAVLAFVGGLLVGRKVWAGKLVGQIGDVAQGVAKKV